MYNCKFSKVNVQGKKWAKCQEEACLKCSQGEGHFEAILVIDKIGRALALVILGIEPLGTINTVAALAQILSQRP